MIEKRKQALDKNEKVDSILKDLCKVFNTQNQLITTQDNGLWLFFQCNKIYSKLFASTFSKDKIIKYKLI